MPITIILWNLRQQDDQFPTTQDYLVTANLKKNETKNMEVGKEKMTGGECVGKNREEIEK